MSKNEEGLGVLQRTLRNASKRVNAARMRLEAAQRNYLKAAQYHADVRHDFDEHVQHIKSINII